ncbi:FHA domain-containing protein [Micrococcus luteus]|uniref:FHA domain-containing protein n=1 Tax=Micrococcus luteus TaxID=1270 RepID=UPI00344D4648
MILGRSAERADLVIPDSSVSREHLRLLTVGSIRVGYRPKPPPKRTGGEHPAA